MITLATLPSATEKEVFDQVSDHLLSQKIRSMKDGVCLYRMSDGRKCAAGCLISDDEYNEEIEGKSWYDLVRSGIVPKNMNS